MHSIEKGGEDNIAHLTTLSGAACLALVAALPAPPDQLLLRVQVRSLLERKLDALPASFRCVFVLRAVDELSVEAAVLARLAATGTAPAGR